MKDDIPDTSGGSYSSGSGGPAMDSDSQPSRNRAADVQVAHLEEERSVSPTQVDVDGGVLPFHERRRRSPRITECLLAPGRTMCQKCTVSSGFARLPERTGSAILARRVLPCRR